MAGFKILTHNKHIRFFNFTLGTHFLNSSNKIKIMYFGTNGVRGLFDKLTPELSLKLSKAFGVYCKRGKVLVARDHRKTSEVLSLSVKAGLASVGCSVVDLGFCPSPTAEFMIKEMRADGLIIITASHNPPEYNALKFVDKNGISISREQGVQIEMLIDKVMQCDFREVKPITKVSPFKKHIESMLSLINKQDIQKRKFKLLIDTANGTANKIAPYLFEKLGCEIDIINSDIDPLFSGRPSEPTEKNLKGMGKSIAQGYDIGIAYDGDSDRVVMFDEKGGFLSGDIVYALNLEFCLKYFENQRYEKKVVTTVATSKIIEDTAKKYGYSTIYTKIGAPYISQAMYEKNARMGGEEVGGIIWPELSLAKDAFFASVRVLEYMAIEDKTLSELRSKLPIYHLIKTKISATEKEKQEMIRRVKEHAKKNGFAINDVDGIRIDYETGWTICRPSGTENYVRVFSEDKDLSRAKKMNEKIINIAKGG